MRELPFIEKIGVLSINPDAATRDDVANMAAQLMEYYSKILELESQLSSANAEIEKLREAIMNIIEGKLLIQCQDERWFVAFKNLSKIHQSKDPFSAIQTAMKKEGK